MANTSGSFTSGSYEGLYYVFNWSKASSSGTTTTCNWTLTAYTSGGYVAERTLILSLKNTSGATIQTLVSKSDRVARYPGVAYSGSFSITHGSEYKFYANIQVAAYESSITINTNSPTWTLPANWTMVGNPTGLQISYDGGTTWHSATQGLIVPEGNAIQLRWKGGASGVNCSADGYQIFMDNGTNSTPTCNFNATDCWFSLSNEYISQEGGYYYASWNGSRTIDFSKVTSQTVSTEHVTTTPSKRGYWFRACIRTFSYQTNIHGWTASSGAYFPAMRINSLPTAPTVQMASSQEENGTYTTFQNGAILNSNQKFIKITSINSSDINSSQTLNYKYSVDAGNTWLPVTLNTPISLEEGGEKTFKFKANDGLEDSENAATFIFNIHASPSMTCNFTPIYYQYKKTSTEYVKAVTLSLTNEQPEYALTVTPVLKWNDKTVELNDITVTNNKTEIVDIVNAFTDLDLSTETEYSLSLNYRDSIEAAANPIVSPFFKLSSIWDPSDLCIRDSYIAAATDLPTSISNTVVQGGNSSYFCRYLTLQRTYNEIVDEQNSSNTLILSHNEITYNALKIETTHDAVRGYSYDKFELSESNLKNIQANGACNSWKLQRSLSIIGQTNQNFLQSYGSISNVAAVSFNSIVNKNDNLINCFTSTDNLILDTTWPFGTGATPDNKYCLENGASGIKILYNNKFKNQPAAFIKDNDTGDFKMVISHKNILPIVARSNDTQTIDELILLNPALDLFEINSFYGSYNTNVQLYVTNKYGQTFVSKNAKYNNNEILTFNYNVEPVINNVSFSLNSLSFNPSTQYLQEGMNIIANVNLDIYSQNTYTFFNQIKRGESSWLDYGNVKYTTALGESSYNSPKNVTISIKWTQIGELFSDETRYWQMNMQTTWMGNKQYSEKQQVFKNILVHVKPTLILSNVTYSEEESNQKLTFYYTLNNLGNLNDVNTFVVQDTAQNTAEYYNMTTSIWQSINGTFPNIVYNQNSSFNGENIKNLSYPVRSRLKIVTKINPGSHTYLLPNEKVAYSNEILVYAVMPTVSYRQNQVGINKKLDELSDKDKQEIVVLVQQLGQNKNLVKLVGFDDNSNSHIITINLKTQEIDGAIIDGGTL